MARGCVCSGTRGGLLAEIEYIARPAIASGGVRGFSGRSEEPARPDVTGPGVAGCAEQCLRRTNRCEAGGLPAAGLDMLKGNPLFGVGIANFRQYSGRLIGHNSAVELMSETGAIGLMLWLSMLYVSTKGLLARRAEATDPQDRWFCTALLLALLSYVVSAMFVTLEYETLYILLAWCAAVNRDVPLPVRFSRGDLFNVGKIAVAWVVGLQSFVIFYLG